MEAQGPLHVRVYPNPFREQAILEFDNPERKTYQLELLDLAGRVVQKFEPFRGNRVDIEAKGMESGLYFFRLSREDTFTGKIILQ